MKLVILDGGTIVCDDLHWDALAALGDLTAYRRTAQADVIARIGDAEAIFTSKCRIDETVLRACPRVRFVAALATGYDNIDVQAAKAHGVAVCNVPAYSTEAVAQHTFALLLEITNHVGLHGEAAVNGEWSRSPDFCLVKAPLVGLSGKSLGIIGFGHIGRRVAAIAEAFGMEVHVYSREPEKTLACDILSLHCPATPQNRGFVNEEFLYKLKRGVILLNTARGALVDEGALAAALADGQVAAAGLDVVDGEPPRADSPLLTAPNVVLTPHIAWATREARATICQVTADNLRSFLSGGDLNRIV